MEVVYSFEELQERPNFHPTLAFHPKGEQRFNEVLLPVSFSERQNCGIASCRSPYLTGYLINTKDGLETAIGGVCGRNHFGVNFTRERKKVDAAVARRRRLDAITAMQAKLPEMESEIVALEQNYKLLREHKERLMGAIGLEVYNALKIRAERGSAKVVRYVPMSEAEAQAHFATTNKPKEHQRDWPQKEITVCTLQGLDFIRSRFKDLIVTTLITPLRELSKLTASDVAELKPRVLASEAKWVGEVPQKIERAQALIDAGWRFFTAENIANLVHVGADKGCLEGLIAELSEGKIK